MELQMLIAILAMASREFEGLASFACGLLVGALCAAAGHILFGRRS